MHQTTAQRSFRLASAEQLCRERGEKLTPLRRRVLEILLGNDTPVGAYAILDTLRQEGHGSGPPTVYRALEFLMHNGLAHRLASLNAFTPCSQPHFDHGPQFLICNQCRRVSEIGSATLSRSIRKQAGQQGFLADTEIVEVSGLCADCNAASPRDVH
jgi:Fur family zinc uptake transcriptional regulator